MSRVAFEAEALQWDTVHRVSEVLNLNLKGLQDQPGAIPWGLA